MDPKQMTLVELRAEIERLDAAATKGPWVPDENKVCTSDLWDLIANTCHYNEKRGFANRDFIAFARTALPEILRRLLVAEEALAALADAGWGVRKNTTATNALAEIRGAAPSNEATS